MHEMSVARSLLDAAIQEACRCGAGAVNCVRCRIGILRQVDSELLQEAFDVLRRDTICRGSRLEIEKVNMRAFCDSCKEQFPATYEKWQCPKCGKAADSLRDGDELNLVSLDVEMDDDNCPEELATGVFGSKCITKVR